MYVVGHECRVPNQLLRACLRSPDFRRAPHPNPRYSGDPSPLDPLASLARGDTNLKPKFFFTGMAFGNLVAAIVDTLRDADVRNDVVRGFLDKLDRLNALTLFGQAGGVMSDIVDVIRETVPGND